MHTKENAINELLSEIKEFRNEIAIFLRANGCTISMQQILLRDRSRRTSSEQIALAEIIAKNHDGKILYSLAEVSKITGFPRNTLPGRLHQDGITVKKEGKRKFVTLFGVSEFSTKNHVAPIDNS